MYSLDMHVEVEAGFYRILAPWLHEPVEGATFEEAYELALRARYGVPTNVSCGRMPTG